MLAILSVATPSQVEMALLTVRNHLARLKDSIRKPIYEEREEFVEEEQTFTRHVPKLTPKGKSRTKTLVLRDADGNPQ